MCSLRTTGKVQRMAMSSGDAFCSQVEIWYSSKSVEFFFDLFQMGASDLIPKTGLHRVFF